MMALQLFFMLAAAGIMITLITLVITVCAYCNRENFYDILIQQNLTFILILIKYFKFSFRQSLIPKQPQRALYIK